MVALHNNVFYVIIFYMLFFSNRFICLSLFVYTISLIRYNLLFMVFSECYKVRHPVGPQY